MKMPKGWKEIRETDRDALSRMFGYFSARRMNRYAYEECQEEIIAMTLENQKHGKTLDDLFPQGLDDFSKQCIDNSPKESIICYLMHFYAGWMIAMLILLLFPLFTYVFSNDATKEIEQYILLCYVYDGSLFIQSHQVFLLLIQVPINVLALIVFARFNLAKRGFALVVLIVLTLLGNIAVTIVDSYVSATFSCPVLLLYLILGGGGSALLGGYYMITKRQWRKAKEI